MLSLVFLIITYILFIKLSVYKHHNNEFTFRFVIFVCLVFKQAEASTKIKVACKYNFANREISKREQSNFHKCLGRDLDFQEHTDR